MKSNLDKVSLHPIDKNAPFVVKTDASDVTLSDVLNQYGKSVAFCSRTFSDSDKWLHSVEKEALAIVDTVRKWKNLLVVVLPLYHYHTVLFLTRSTRAKSKTISWLVGGQNCLCLIITSFIVLGVKTKVPTHSRELFVLVFFVVPLQT